MEQRKALYEKRKLISAMVEAAGTFIENPVDELTWKEVEDRRKELATIQERVASYIEEIDNFIMDQATDWQEQWDLAFIIYNQENKREHKNLEKLTENLVKRGLNKTLAASIATKLVSPDEENTD